MEKPRGAVRDPNQVAREAQNFLMEHFEGVQPFTAAVHTLARTPDLRTVLRDSSRQWGEPPLLDYGAVLLAPERGPWPFSTSFDTAFLTPAQSAYCDNVRTIADEWGLRAEWAYAWIHSHLMQIAGMENRFRVGGLSGPWGYRLNMADYPPPIPLSFDSESAFSARADRWAKAVWLAHEMSLEAAGWERQDTRSSLEAHCRWLFKRICPVDGQATRPKGFAVIGREELFSAGAVAGAVRRLAGLLRLHIPPLPPGRPSRFPSI